MVALVKQSKAKKGGSFLLATKVKGCRGALFLGLVGSWSIKEWGIFALIDLLAVGWFVGL